MGGEKMIEKQWEEMGEEEVKKVLLLAMEIA